MAERAHRRRLEALRQESAGKPPPGAARRPARSVRSDRHTGPRHPSRTGSTPARGRRSCAPGCVRAGDGRRRRPSTRGHGASRTHPAVGPGAEAAVPSTRAARRLPARRRGAREWSAQRCRRRRGAATSQRPDRTASGPTRVKASVPARGPAGPDAGSFLIRSRAHHRPGGSGRSTPASGPSLHTSGPCYLAGAPVGGRPGPRAAEGSRAVPRGGAGARLLRLAAGSGEGRPAPGGIRGGRHPTAAPRAPGVDR